MRLTSLDRLSLTLSRYLFAGDQETQFAVSAWIFIRLLAIVYFFKFLSISIQAQDWIGSGGIYPVQKTLALAKDQLSVFALFKYPTFFWYGANDFFITLLIWIGLLSSALLFFCIHSGGFLVVLYLSFLSFTSVGGDFFTSVGDRFLLEAGFFAMFFTSFVRWLPFRRSPSPTPIFRFLYWILIGRVFLHLLIHEVMKIDSGQESSFLLWIYIPFSFLFALGTFGPSLFRRKSAAGLFLLQVGYVILGSQKVFPFLILISCTLYFDDSFWSERFPKFSPLIERLAGNKYRGVSPLIQQVVSVLVVFIFLGGLFHLLPFGLEIQKVTGNFLGLVTQFGVGQDYSF